MKQITILMVATAAFSLSAAYIFAQAKPQTQDAVRIKHILFEPTESDKMTLYDVNGQSYPITTHKFGTLIKAAQELKTTTPHSISVKPIGGAELSETFQVWTIDPDIYIKREGLDPFKINSSMAWSTCRNLLNCGDYLQTGIYSDWG